jgi:hypothetical protein
MGHLTLIAIQILLAAQASQATVAGTIRDAETSAPLAGAIVILADLDRGAVTDSSGRYRLANVPAGPQHLTVRLFGYTSRSLHALVPRTGELEINVSLRAQPIQLQPVEVHGPVRLRGLDRSDTTMYPDRRISSAAVRNHPMLAESDVFQALGGGEVVLRPESPSGVHIRGGASDQTAYLLDGVPVFSPYHAAGVSSAWNPDALARLDLSSSMPSMAYPHVLSGTIEGFTRAPGTRLGVQGSLSTSQARVTLDGPFGRPERGYVASFRSGLPEVLSPRNDSSYLRGGTGDWLAKLESPLWGGRTRLLGYGNGNEISPAARATGQDETTEVSDRNLFEWYSRSLGLEWRREGSTGSVRARAWSAAGDAGSAWTTPSVSVEMAGTRRDLGLLVGGERRWARGTSEGEMRFERIETSYRVDFDSAGAPSVELNGEAPLVSAVVRHSVAVHPRVDLEAGATVAVSGDVTRVGPRAQCRCRVTERLTVSGSLARNHQFAQSLRNPESVVGNVFPVDVYIVAGAPGAPVARSDQGLIAADYRPLAGMRLGLQVYERHSGRLVLVAPRDGGPFTTSGFVIGSGSARGLSVDLALSSARFGMIATYGLQRVRLEYGDSSFVPDHGARHLLEFGTIVFPTATTSVRIGGTAALGRRTTTTRGGFEWESCNLLDRGCEFAGSPDHSGETLGGTELPPYFRVM